MTSNPKLAVCSCLLKNRNRHNGDSTEFRGLNDNWSKSFELVEVCPENELDMGVSNSALRLIKDQDRISLINPENGEDYTEAMLKYAEKKSDYLVASGICGFVFARDSPVFGLEKVMVYCGENRLTISGGAGMFSKVFTTLYPQVPVIEGESLSNHALYENFTSRVNLYYEWEKVGRTGWTKQKLQSFHEQNKDFIQKITPGAESILSVISSQISNENQHPEYAALDYITQAEKYLSDSIKTENIASDSKQLQKTNIANI